MYQKPCYVADINECQTNMSTCSHGCTNIDAGYTCSCPIGFSLSSDQRTCLGSLLLYF